MVSVLVHYFLRMIIIIWIIKVEEEPTVTSKADVAALMAAMKNM